MKIVLPKPIVERLPLAIALGSGICMGLTPAPTNLWPLAWVALAPLWILIHPQSKIQSLRFKLLLCLMWGIGYHGVALSWIRDLHPLTWMGVPWLGSVAITLFAWVFITLWGAAIPMTWCLGLHFWEKLENWGIVYGPRRGYERRRSLPYLLVAIALWGLIEFVWNLGPLDWTSLSFTQSPYNLLILHLGRLSGPATITAAIVAVNGLFAEAWIHWRTKNESHKSRKILAVNILLIITLHLIGFVLYSQPLVDASNTALKIGIVQGNVPTRIKLFEQGLRLSLENFTRGYETLADVGVDAVLMSEGALPWQWIGTPYQTQNILYQTIQKRGVTAWVGTIGTRQNHITQSLFTITGKGEIYSQYDKIKLVPLGEYIPFEDVMGKFINRLSPVSTSLRPGRLDQYFDTPFGRAIAGICYESAFSRLFRNQAKAGGEFILTASNNDPYGYAMMSQHHAQDLMRAVESDRWAVRATNTGLSGIVDPHGNTRWLSGFRTYETHVHTIYRQQTQTLYVRWGDWLTKGLGLLLLVGIGDRLKNRLTGRTGRYSRSHKI